MLAFLQTINFKSMKNLAQISRVLVGVLFIISGLIKANDTLGFSYKLEEYFEVFGWPVFVPWAHGLSMFICVFEIVCGVTLLLGAYARLNAWLLLLMILFFTWLTGYSAFTNKVTDCGCFGDAIKLKPLQSFYKDLILLVLISFIFFGVKHIKPLFNKSIQSIALFVAIIVSAFFTFYTAMFLPVVDFLPYKEGNDIAKLTSCPPGSPVDSFAMVFIYEKNGVKEEFDMNHIPSDTNYHFVDRIDKLIREGCKPPIHDFRLTGTDGLEYVDSLFAKDEYKLVLVQSDLKSGHKGAEKQLAELAEESKKNGVELWALSNNAWEEIETYRHEHQLAFPYYQVDRKPLLSIVRSNPGLVLMKKSTVIKKWSAFEIPTYELVKKHMK